MSHNNILRRRLTAIVGLFSHKRPARASIGIVFLLFLGALFGGTIFIPQVLLMVYPPLGTWLASIPINIGGLSFNLLGFLFGGLLSFPILVWALRSQNATNIQG